MSKLSYRKRLATPIDEMNPLGVTQFEELLYAFSSIFRQANVETVNYILPLDEFGDNEWNEWKKHLQIRFKINARQANGIICWAKGQVKSAIECRKNHIDVLRGKLKSAKSWVKEKEDLLKKGRKYVDYILEEQANSKREKPKKRKKKVPARGLPLSMSIDKKRSSWQELKFQIHNKKRYIHTLEKKIAHLSYNKKPMQVKVPEYQVFAVGSSDETLGNQVCQWDGDVVTYRVPYCLEERFGTHVSTRIGNFERKVNRLPQNGAKSWHFFHKNGKWNATVQFTPEKVETISRHSDWGCIAIDLNPSSVGWAYVDKDGNLKDHGTISLQSGLPKGKQQAEFLRVIKILNEQAVNYPCPIGHEKLDFEEKKVSLREQGKKYSTMLSGWGYKKFFELLKAYCNNRGIYVYDKIRPEYSSISGMIKVARMYGLGSDESAAYILARQFMRLKERVPASIYAYLNVKLQGKSVWSQFKQVNNFLKSRGIINRRHDYYTISNWESEVKLWKSKPSVCEG
ncbi:MAG: hypothetical protein QNJ47_13060 [Nostocaceae cyanobacterium]|nr:hypothetical protein [Nostocaceae cyanobacterium]